MHSMRQCYEQAGRLEPGRMVDEMEATLSNAARDISPSDAWRSLVRLMTAQIAYPSRHECAAKSRVFVGDWRRSATTMVAAVMPGCSRPHRPIRGRQPLPTPHPGARHARRRRLHQRRALLPARHLPPGDRPPHRLHRDLRCRPWLPALVPPLERRRHREQAHRRPDPPAATWFAGTRARVRPRTAHLARSPRRATITSKCKKKPVRHHGPSALPLLQTTVGCHRGKDRRPWKQTGPRKSWSKVTPDRSPCCWPCARNSG